jgi:hypothetical protein
MSQKHLPRYILRNCMLWTDGNLQLGQIADVSPPVPTVKTEEMRNAGMVLPIKVHLGYEALEFSFKMPGFDPDVLALFGLEPGTETPFMITGATIDEDGTEHSSVLTIRGMLAASKSTRPIRSTSRFAASPRTRRFAALCCSIDIGKPNQQARARRGPFLFFEEFP